jgi:hypothetical protein
MRIARREEIVEGLIRNLILVDSTEFSSKMITLIKNKEFKFDNNLDDLIIKVKSLEGITFNSSDREIVIQKFNEMYN